ncbi:Periplasmic thiol:disulfide oxidoreductase DsbB, required for DsbA reoxidation [Altererythrobacter epoxidivorans]|uniref:Periplasmic thiol:disulfide oxidoreductase DsbB, required for DsbA reoxidation n=1 Tax=Altererythrobacter epoxidivorans TaxID=361183 RepID=A0A0M3TB48_9SPHN|nr:disulfide bond formation protein B [Altererythrobacter epoxidivorans]ALE17866.1 Periplasmic thiol:disulfide oxidoreductase DsbB, required for DsbA reoxidation [Altererythrobacter epoxidivorans]
MEAIRTAPLAQRLALGIPLLLLGGAYLGQFGFDLYPCEMCWWQRYPHFAAVGFGLVSFLVPPRNVWVVLAALCILASGLIGGFHAGVEYGWWEGITACASTIEPGANAMDAILNAPLVRCDAAPWDLFGISLAGWNFLISTVSGLAILWLVARKKGA